MTLFDWTAKLRDALRQAESSDQQGYGTEQLREEREQATLNILKGEIGERATDRYQERRYRKRALRLAIPAFVVSLATLVAVGYYAWVAAQQREEMKRAADAAVNAASAAWASNEQAHRAWLLVRESTPLELERDSQCPIYPADVPLKKPRTIISQLRAGASYCVRLTVENTGQASPGTVSFGVFASAISGVPEAELMRSPPYPPTTAQQRISRTVVGSKHHHYIIVTQISKGPDGKPVNREVVDYVNSGVMRLYVYGRIEYEDAFGKSRETKFCLAWVPKLGSFDTCEAYNEVK